MTPTELVSLGEIDFTEVTINGKTLKTLTARGVRTMLEQFDDDEGVLLMITADPLFLTNVTGALSITPAGDSEAHTCLMAERAETVLKQYLREDL